MKPSQSMMYVSELKTNALNTVQNVQRNVSDELKNIGIREHSRESRLLVSHVLKMDMVELISSGDIVLGGDDLIRLKKLVQRRLSGMPVSRLVGQIEFYGLQFEINEKTLVPRSDTGTLVDAVLDDHKIEGDSKLRVLDMGSGTGAIIISILANRPSFLGTATDIDEKALEMTAINARNNSVLDRLDILKSDWCESVKNQFDIIVSNPPYIRTAIISGLAPEVKNHDPHIALDGGIDGLNAYRDIFTQCSQKIAKNGRLYLEIGFDQAQAVIQLANQSNWKFCRLIKDLDQNNRVLIFQR